MDRQLLFNDGESINDAIGTIMDYLLEQTPGRSPVTKTEAIRYAITIAALNIQNEKMNQADK